MSRDPIDISRPEELKFLKEDMKDDCLACRLTGEHETCIPAIILRNFVDLGW